MLNRNELLVSARDAEELALLLDGRRRMDAREAESANALADALVAQYVADDIARMITKQMKAGSRPSWA